MDLDAAALTRVLGLCAGEQPGGPEETVLLLRQSQPSFAPTMYSAWQSEGRKLNPALQYELDVQRRRVQRYRQVAADLAVAEPSIVALKGLEVADRYPPGWIRYMNDLDYTIPEEPVLWRVVDALTRAGWEVDTGTFSLVDGWLQIMVSLRQQHEDPYSLPYGVEVLNYVAAGDLAGVPALTTLPVESRVSTVKNLLMLLFERFEQRYRARDIVDAAVLLDASSADHRAALHRTVHRLGLWPEYTELGRLLTAAELGPRLSLPPQNAVLATRINRSARHLARLRHPLEAAVVHLQRRMIFGLMRPPERWMWATAQARLSASRALRTGLQCFGLPIDDGQPGLHTARIRERGDIAWVDTPVCRFLLTAGDEVEQSTLDLLATQEPVPGGSPEPAPAGELPCATEPAR